MSSIVIEPGPPVEVQIVIPSPFEIEVQTVGGRGQPGTPADNTEITNAINEHVDNETPHPVYDDGPSFVLLYENAKV